VNKQNESYVVFAISRWVQMPVEFLSGARHLHADSLYDSRSSFTRVKCTTGMDVGKEILTTAVV